jgi:hypothetical protein
MPHMGITEYARHRGVEDAAVHYAVQMGRIRRNPDGLIDAETADRDWVDNTQEREPKSSGSPRGHYKPLPPVERALEPVPGITYSDARALREVYVAQKHKLSIIERSGKMVDRQEVEEEASRLFRMLRDACFNLPPRLAAQLAAETDEMAVFDILEGALRRVFEDFAEGRLQ